MKAFKVYPFNLAAGASQVILAEGSFVRIKTATGDVALTLDDIGPFAPVSVGQGFNLAGSGQGFKRVTLTDVSGSANAGQLIVADSSFIDQTLAGTVSVIDGEKARSLAGASFMGSAYSGAAVAAQFPAVQLWNPAGTSTNLVVSQVVLSSATAQGIAGGGTQSALTTDNTSTRVASKLLNAGAGASVAKSTGQVAAAQPTAARAIFNGFVPASQNVLLPLKGPIVVPPGWGLTLYGFALNSDLSAQFEWFEQSVTASS